MKKYDVIVIGAGAAGLMCASETAKRGRSVCIIEHRAKIGEKIRISGGGRCNFTNLYCSPDNFISQNPHFCKSALARYTQHDFIALLDEHGIGWHEKKHDVKAGNENARGQLFCDNSATDIIEMFKKGCDGAGVHFALKTKVQKTEKTGQGFGLQTDQGDYACESLVIASGGLSIPKIGASNFGYEVAKSFGLNIVPPSAALVPLTFDEDLLAKTKPLSGVAVDASVAVQKTAFREGLLFTHKGLSGPSILQISSYWNNGEAVRVNLMPDGDALDKLKNLRKDQPKQALHNALSAILPQRLAQLIADVSGYDTRMADLSDKKLQDIAALINNWQVVPNGTEGYRTAEVTRGGVDTDEISSKTFEAKKVAGLYFIGEVLDVTGHLGGHNFQWAWASGWCAGQNA